MTRTKSIKIRLSEDELSQLKHAAGKRGVSALLRRRALGMHRQQHRIDQLAVLAELARFRNLLTQIARDCQRRALPEQMQIVFHLVAVERQLSKFKTP